MTGSVPGCNLVSPYQDEYRYIYSFMTDYVRSTVPRGPQIVITGAEGDNNPTVRPPLQPQDGLSTDDSVSSQAGSFETALDDVMDTMLPGNPEVRSSPGPPIFCLSRGYLHPFPRFFRGYFHPLLF